MGRKVQAFSIAEMKTQKIEFKYNFMVASNDFGIKIPLDQKEYEFVIY